MNLVVLLFVMEEMEEVVRGKMVVGVVLSWKVGTTWGLQGW